MAELQLKSVGMMAPNGTRILSDLSFKVGDGELLVLVGRSGSGKTSVIRAIAGLESIDSGSVLFDDVDMSSVPLSDRDVGLVFQEAGSLFPNFTAWGNVSFALRIRKQSKPTIRDRVAAEARALGITAIMERWPRELSAGHQQLVQIARAMVRVPNVLLLDEPMAYVDPPTRARLRRDLKELQKGYGITTILATNHADEAMAMADRIAVIDEGHLAQIGSPSDLYSGPANMDVATLTGPISFVTAVVAAEAQGFWLIGDGFRLRAWPPRLSEYVGESVTVGIRPDAVRLQPTSEIRLVLDGYSYNSGSPSSVAFLGGSVLTMPYVDQPLGTEVAVSVDKFLVFTDNGKLLAVCG